MSDHCVERPAAPSASKANRLLRSLLIRAAPAAIAGAATMASLGGCITGGSGGRGHVLYAPVDPPPPREQVAELSGYVRFVDGVDVSEHGRSFELLPGCHLVGTPSQWWRTTETTAIRVKTTQMTFALAMKAGYEYEIAVAVQDGASYLRVVIEAYEKDGHGHRVKTLEPASSQDIQACRDSQHPSI